MGAEVDRCSLRVLCPRCLDSRAREDCGECEGHGTRLCWRLLDEQGLCERHGGTFRGHHVSAQYLGEGITHYIVREHTDGLVGGRGSHGAMRGAIAEIKRCAAGEPPSDWYLAGERKPGCRQRGREEAAA